MAAQRPGRAARVAIAAPRRKRPRDALAAACGCVWLAGCAAGSSHADTAARYGLSVFCAAHDAGIVSILVSFEQRHAGWVVCKAAGYPFGRPPMEDPR